MTRHKRFNYTKKEEFLADLEARGVKLPFCEDTKVLCMPLEIAGRTCPNRLIVHPMEGFDADSNGTPGELALRRYVRYAEGGSGLIWFEATAVVPEGRSNPNQFYINEDNVHVYKKLVKETKAAARKFFGWEPIVILQLTHSGRYSRPVKKPAPVIAHHSPILDPRHGIDEACPLVEDAYLDDLQGHFVAAAELAAKAGFDGVDVKCCHRYLVSELLASHTRIGKYGGSFENRTRFLRETLAKIKAAVPEVFSTTRMNAYDAIRYPYGWGVSEEDYRVHDLTEPKRLVKLLEQAGIPLLNISIGNPYFNPHFGRPYDNPVENSDVPSEHPLEGIERFITITADIQKTCPDLPVVGSGYAWLRQFMPNVGAAVLKEGKAALIGQGRGAFAYPDAYKDLVEKGSLERSKCCIACSNCTQIMRDGNMTGCVIRDSEIYLPQYKLGRRAAS